MHLMHLSLSVVASPFAATICKNNFSACVDANKVEISLATARDTSGPLAVLFCCLPRKG